MASGREKTWSNLDRKSLLQIDEQGIKFKKENKKTQLGDHYSIYTRGWCLGLRWQQGEGNLENIFKGRENSILMVVGGVCALTGGVVPVNLADSYTGEKYLKKERKL